MRPQFVSVFHLLRRAILHLTLIPLGYCLAFLLRFDFNLPPEQVGHLLKTLPFVVMARFLALWGLGLHRGSLRHSGVVDLRRLVLAISASSGAFLLGLYLVQRLDHFPRSIFFLDWVLAIGLLGGVRVAVRLWHERLLLPRRGNRDATPVLIVGGGNAGARLIRELQMNPTMTLVPVAIVDDDPQKRGMHLHGVSVEGTIAEVDVIVRSCGARMIIIAAPSATAAEMQRMVKICTETGLKVRVVPTLRELMEGSANLAQIREVQIEDLLGRDTIDLDLGAIRQQINNRVVLITGGAGSIGSELARQVAALGPRRLVLLEQAESPLYFIDLELRGRHPDIEIVPVMADVTNETRVAEVFAQYRPDYVFHAAAYKHVPMMEHSVGEAVRNNVRGTLCVARNAAAVGTKRFVLISTDKAVHPSSVMGATKRIAERMILGHPGLRGSGTDFRAVRFGNVLGSDGSVIPLFRKQLAKGGPLTVTHPDMTRFFMTIPEAAQLVLMAGSLPEAAGRISMLEMGQPVKIVDLAENLIRLSGLTPGVDIKIAFTGMRPGEKVHEELMSDVEATVPTAVSKIRIVQTDETPGRGLEVGLERLFDSLELPGTDAALDAIRALVPECVAPLRDRRDEPAAANVPTLGLEGVGDVATVNSAPKQANVAVADGRLVKA